MTAEQLLKWLGESEFSQYGECYGPALDALVHQGLAQVHEPGADQYEFAMKGKAIAYRAVSLTDAGRIALAKLGKAPS